MKMASAPDLGETTAILLGAGDAGRPTGPPQPLRRVLDRPLLDWSLAACEATAAITEVVLVVPAEFVAEIRTGIVQQLAPTKPVRVVASGGRRHRDAVAAGLEAVAPGVPWILVHETTRPLASADLFRRVIGAARARGAASASLEPVDALHWRSRAGDDGGGLPLDQLVSLQTPQAFSASILRGAYDQSPPDLNISDEAALLSSLGYEVAMVAGERDNLKITDDEDFGIVERLAEGREGARNVPSAVRTGFGQEAYRLVQGKPLLLAGVHVPGNVGLDGYGDADLVCHAACQALLGAAGLGDVDEHFSPRDPRWRRIGGTPLLARVAAMIGAAGYLIENLDSLVVWDPGRLAPYRDAMRKNLTTALGVGRGRVSVKTSNAEVLSFGVGGEGIMAQVVACLRSVSKWNSAMTLQ